MKSGDTSLGGARRAFPTTSWVNVLAAGNPSHPESREQLARLLEAYWKPVYACIRAAWRKPSEEAKDLTQAFFARLLQAGSLSRAHPDRGTFRSYLKGALAHFLIDAERHAAARRPEGPMIRLDGDLEAAEPASRDETPEQAYDREWFRCLFQASVAGLKDLLAAEQKEAYFEVFRVYCLDPSGSASSKTTAGKNAPGAPTYRAVADRLGLRESDVRNYLAYCRRAFRKLLRARIRDYAATEKDADREFEEALRG